MFRKLIALIRLEIILEFAYPISLLFFLVLPLTFTAAVGAGLEGMTGENDDPQEFRTRIYVVDYDGGPLVENLLDALAETNLVPEVVESLPENAFGLEVPDGFSQNLMAGQQSHVNLHILPAATASQAVDQYVRGAISRIGAAALIADQGVSQARDANLVDDVEEAQEFFNHVFNTSLQVAEDPPAEGIVIWSGNGVDEVLRQNQPTAADQASAGQIVTWVQITLLGAAEVFASERLGGTMHRLLVTPASRATLIGGKLLARLTLGLVQMALLFIGGILLFGVNWGRNPLALIAVSLAFAMATVGLGMLVATFVRTRGQAGSVVVGLAMGLAALGGAWYPLEITPRLYQQVVQILPSTWAMRAYTDLLVRGAGLMEVLPAVGVLVLFALVFTTLGIVRFQSYE